jgi:hypothetical protein
VARIAERLEQRVAHRVEEQIGHALAIGDPERLELVGRREHDGEVRARRARVMTARVAVDR